VSKKNYQRVLLKFSGEFFQNDTVLTLITNQIVQLRQKRIKLAVVIGGGNIIRGRTAQKFTPTAADHAGMLATVINGIVLTDILQQSITVCHLAAFPVGNLVPAYTVDRAQQALKENKIVVLSGGTGNPFFSTDSAAALRAIELKMDIILKGTKVPGVFSADPKKYPDARFYPQLSYQKALTEGLEIMDRTAFALCQQHRIPIIVFDITQPDAILKIIGGKKIGSCIC